ncbi:hypothetical protein [Paenibacillus silvisoli]|uniref:hypothetical protein n=1 Tax=Paenibacillus silvisoli TaxID=3110539 RepID=UPI00280559A5|nr:hypothetical protein [Paenibacillus silvisoli]
MKSEKDMIGAALKTAVEYETHIAMKYANITKTVTDPAIQQQLKSLEQTARNHLNLLSKQMQELNN